jgi:hypothetical protein
MTSILLAKKRELLSGIVVFLEKARNAFDNENRLRLLLRPAGRG